MEKLNLWTIDLSSKDKLRCENMLGTHLFW